MKAYVTLPEDYKLIIEAKIIKEKADQLNDQAEKIKAESIEKRAEITKSMKDSADMMLMELFNVEAIPDKMAAGSSTGDAPSSSSGTSGSRRRAHP